MRCRKILPTTSSGSKGRELGDEGIVGEECGKLAGVPGAEGGAVWRPRELREAIRKKSVLF